MPSVANKLIEGQVSNNPFLVRLRNASAQNGSWLLVGLDPILERLPEGIQRTPKGVGQFLIEIIESTADIAMGYKLNFAFYEIMGAEGWRVLEQTLAAIPTALFRLADAKRGDIGDTAEMYARNIFDRLNFDAATVQPYVGLEGVQPFLDRAEKGTFVVCRTTNRDAALQDIRVGSGSLYEEVARRALQWGANVGFVVGGTDISGLEKVREIAPSVPFLVPGFGAQAADERAAVHAAVDVHGENALFAASRSILFASSAADYATEARKEASRLNQTINSGRDEHRR